MLVELHCHTRYSRGKKILYDAVDSPRDIIRQAERLGLGAINISDHNTIKGALKAKKYARNIKVITGEEISSNQGHILAVGINETIPPKLEMAETLDRIREQGGVAIAAHPFDIHNDGVGVLCMECDAVEVFNSQNMDRISNNKCLGFARRNNLSMTAGSDAHSAEMVGYGINKIEADSIEVVLKSIKKGELMPIKKYIPLHVMRRLVVRKLQLSYDHTTSYMQKNHSWTSAALTRTFIKLVRKSPGRIDNIFSIMAYMFLGGSVVYMGLRQLV